MLLLNLILLGYSGKLNLRNLANFILCQKNETHLADHQKQQLGVKDGLISFDNNAEAILDKALGEFRLKLAANGNESTTREPETFNDLGVTKILLNVNEQQKMTDIIMQSHVEITSQQPDVDSVNIVVNANHVKEKTRKFEFIPHFNKAVYEYMVPEGLNENESLTAVVNFIGDLDFEMPIFSIKSDRLNLFEIGHINSTERTNYMEFAIPIMLKSGTNVNVSQIPNGAYNFRLEALQNGHKSISNVRVEILTSNLKKIFLTQSEITRDQQSSAIENSVNDESITTIDNNNLDLITGTNTLVTRSATLPNADEMESTITNDDFMATNNGTKTIGVNVTDQETIVTTESNKIVTTERVETQSTTGIDIFESTTQVVLTSENNTIMNNVEVEVSTLAPSVVTETVNSVSESTINESTTVESLSLESINTDVNSSVNPETTPSKELSPTDSSTILPVLQQSDEQLVQNESKNETNIENNQLTRVNELKETQSFVSQGVQIEITGTRNSVVGIPANLGAFEPLNSIQIRLVMTDPSNLLSTVIQNEIFKLEINPKGILDVKPHFMKSEDVASFILIDPTYFDTGKALNFTIETRLANSQLREENAGNFVAKREFSAQKLMKSQLKFSENNYEFNVEESSETGTKVGQIIAALIDTNSSDSDVIHYHLNGNGAENFKINENGEIQVNCHSERCLDSESVAIYYLIGVATFQGTSSSIPIKVNVNDVNDNAPIIRIFDSEIHIIEDEIFTPFLIYVTDVDLKVENRKHKVELDGSASEFLSLEKLSDSLYNVQISAFVSPGIYTLVIVVQNDGNQLKHMQNQGAQRVPVNVIVKKESSKIRFTKNLYKRTINSERLIKGNPLVQVELRGVALDSISFVVLENNPGWLAMESYSGNAYVGDVPKERVKTGQYMATIGVVDRDSQKVLAKCMVEINVVGSKENNFVFQKPFYSVVLQKDLNFHNVSRTLPIMDVEVTNTVLKILPETIQAYDNSGNIVDITEEQYISLTETNEIVLNRPGLNTDKIKNIQQVFFQIQNMENERDRALFSIVLSSEYHKVMEKLCVASQPKFLKPLIDETTSIKLRIPEELPKGHIILHLPAYSPLSGNMITNYSLTGKSAHYFNVDMTKATIEIAKRIDYEALTNDEKNGLEIEVHAFGNTDEQLIFNSITSTKNYMEAIAKLEVQIFNVDDSPPIIQLHGANRVQISENIKPGAVVLQFTAKDSDSKKLKYYISGSKQAMENFKIQQKEDFQLVVVSPDANIDREVSDQCILVITCVDPAGNKNQVEIEVTISDENDNRPLFTSNSISSDIHTYDNWPSGIVLAKLVAKDKDIGLNGKISYSLAPIPKINEEYFDINEEIGLLSTIKPLAGLVHRSPYTLTITATDHGTPSFSSSKQISFYVHEASTSSDFDDKLLRFTQPSVDYVLKLSEDVPIGRKVFDAVARVGRNTQVSSIIRYSLEEADKSNDIVNGFRIDELSGEIFTNKILDYEVQKFTTVGLLSYCPK